MAGEKGCAFCAIARGEAPAEVLYEDGLVIAFRDSHPRASTHVLIVPKSHYVSIVDDVPTEVLGAMVAAVHAVAEGEGVADGGFRVVCNTGLDAGQTVGHLHWHLIGGRYPGRWLVRLVTRALAGRRRSD